MTNLLQFARIFESPTVNITAVCNYCAKIWCYSSEFIFTFLYGAAA
jgi:hypothetical protein